MDEIIRKISDDSLIAESMEKFKIEKNKSDDYEFEESEDVIEFFEFYIPELHTLSNEDYTQMLLQIDEYMTELLLKFRPVAIEKATAFLLMKESNYLFDVLVEQNPNLLDEEFVEFLLSDDKRIPKGLYNYLNNDFVVDAIIKKLESQEVHSRVQIDLTKLEKIELSDSAKTKIFSGMNFSYSDIPEKFLRDEVVVNAMLKGEYGLPLNAHLIPLHILEQNSELVVLYIKEHCNYYSSSAKEFLEHAFQSDILVTDYVSNGKIEYSIFKMIPESKLELLENNIDVIIKNAGYSSSYLINDVTKKSKVFFEKLWYGNLESFEPHIIAEEVEFLFNNGFDISKVYGKGMVIYKNSQFIKNALDYQIKNNLPLTIIKCAEGDAFNDNILHALENGFDYKNVDYNMQVKLFNSETVIKYLIANNEIEFLLSHTTSDVAIKFEDLLEPIAEIREDYMHVNLLSSAKITRKLLKQSNYDFSLLAHVRLYDVKDVSAWIPLVEEICDMGFRIDKAEICRAIVNTKELASTYMKKTGDHSLVDKVGLYGEDITELVELAASLGYVLNENTYNELLETNELIIKNSLLYGDAKYFDRIGRLLSKEETDLAYSRGYTISSLSSFWFKQNVYAFEKEFALGNFDKIGLLIVEASDSLIQAYFDNGYVINENTTSYVRSNPLAIHLMFEKTNDINVINLAIENIYREDFIKAIDMGYVVNENTPIGIINNNVLMGFYLEKQIEAKPELKDLVTYLLKNDKLGVNGTAASFDVILSNPEFTETFKNIELVKLVKFVYFSSDSKQALVEIANNGNVVVLKRIYEICSSLSNSSDFDVVMLKNIVMHFSQNEALCKAFISKEYTPSDVQLLYNFVVNGTLNEGYVYDLETLRNYKKIMYEKNLELVKADFVSREKLLDAIFKLLCNKTYEEISALIGQFFNVNRIDELLAALNNEQLCEELKNYRVFMELIEQIYKINDINSLEKILLSLNEQSLNGSKDLDLIWSNFKNITAIAKRFYGEEIREKITDISMIESLESTQVISGEEVVDENAKAVVRKGKYTTDEFVYRGETYDSAPVDLIEFTGMPFVSFAHVLNAYGSGATVSDFKNPRLIGRTYICLSAISEKKFGVVDRVANDIDHVTLLFSEFSSDQLALASDRDIASHGENNDLELTSWGGSNFRPVRNIIDDTVGYNEYVMYRENSAGNIIMPSAVLITGDEPNEAEKQAAVYLGVPLVKINRNKYLNTNSYDIEHNEITPSEILNKKDKWVTLKKSIEEIQSILVADEDEMLVEEGIKKM